MHSTTYSILGPIVRTCWPVAGVTIDGSCVSPVESTSFSVLREYADLRAEILGIKDAGLDTDQRFPALIRTRSRTNIEASSVETDSPS